MGNDPIIGWAWSTVLLSLRVAPVFALAPPFTLIRMPLLFRMLLSLGLAACIAAANPAAAALADSGAGTILVAAVFVLMAMGPWMIHQITQVAGATFAMIPELG